MNSIPKIIVTALLGIILPGCDFSAETFLNTKGKHFSRQIPGKTNFPGQSLPGSWRPFSDDSPWNTPVPADAKVHSLSREIIGRMSSTSGNIRFGNYYLVPLWVVNSDQMEHYPAKASYPFDIWDCDNDFLTDTGVPFDSSMWGEQTEDGHIVLIDTLFDLSWEMSRFKGIKNGIIDCSTFNIWDLTGNGTGDPNEGKRWKARGGRGSGFPEIAGLIRPEEIADGEIRHALAFTFSEVKKEDFYYPACRSDGKADHKNAPAEGMLFQLNPRLTDSDFDEWGLSEGAQVVAHALQQYGMYLCDAGGDMALQVQLLDKDREQHRKKWDKVSPGMYSTITNIPTDQFRLIDTGEPLSGGASDVVTTPLIIPACGTFKRKAEINIMINKDWPDAMIHFTLDGSDPGEISPLYEKPFTMKSTGIIKAVAFDAKGKKSKVMRAPLIIN